MLKGSEMAEDADVGGTVVSNHGAYFENPPTRTDALYVTEIRSPFHFFRLVDDRSTVPSARTPRIPARLYAFRALLAAGNEQAQEAYALGTGWL
jgi:hypothetical protein